MVKVTYETHPRRKKVNTGSEVNKWVIIKIWNTGFPHLTTKTSYFYLIVKRVLGKRVV